MEKADWFCAKGNAGCWWLRGCRCCKPEFEGSKKTCQRIILARKQGMFQQNFSSDWDIIQSERDYFFEKTAITRPFASTVPEAFLRVKNNSPPVKSPRSTLVF
jgi:hypothetical protein